MESRYHKLNNPTAQLFLQSLEQFSQTEEGQRILKRCGFNRIIVRGSGAFIISSEDKLFERAIGDLDLKIVSQSPARFHTSEALKLMPEFFARAIDSTGLELSLIPNDPVLYGNKAAEWIIEHMLPRQSFKLSSSELPEFGIGISYYTRQADMPLEDLNGQLLPAVSSQLICLENIYERLANHISAINNPMRYFSRESGAGIHKIAQDILGGGNLMFMAQSRGNSMDDIRREMEKFRSKGLRTQYGRRNALEEVRNVLHSRVVGDVTHAVSARQMEELVHDEIRKLQEVGLITFYHDVNLYQLVMETRELARALQPPFSKTVGKFIFARPISDISLHDAATNQSHSEEILRHSQLGTILGNIYANMSWQTDSRMRLPTFILSVIGNSQINLIGTWHRLHDITVMGASPHIMHLVQSPTLFRDLLSASEFIGYGLNNFLGDFTPAELLDKLEAVQGNYSQIVLEAMGNSTHNCKLKFPDTLDNLERYGLITKKDFFAFANLFTSLECEMAREGKKIVELNALAGDNRSAICEARERMIDINQDQTAILYSFFSHLFNRNNILSSSLGSLLADDVTLLADIDLLRSQFPKEFKIGRAAQLEFANHDCLNRILSEILQGTIKPDPIILTLERNSAYDRGLKEDLLSLVLENIHDRTFPLSRLPENMRNAIEQNCVRIMHDIDEIDAGPLSRTAYRFYTEIGIRGGTKNTFLRHLAGQQEKSIEDSDLRQYLLQLRQEWLNRDTNTLENSKAASPDLDTIVSKLRQHGITVSKEPDNGIIVGHGKKIGGRIGMIPPFK